MRRCGWVQGGQAVDVAYHDHEWGVPVHDEQRWFEFLILEGAQAGLSWSTILRKREHYRQVYEGFDPARVARFDADRQAQLLQDAGIVRNRLKVAASVINAQRFLAVQDEFGSFDAYIWRFVDGSPLQPGRASPAEIPARTPESDALSKDLRKRGFKFVGSTICYALMQAAGLVNDHQTDCFRHAVVRRLR